MKIMIVDDHDGMRRMLRSIVSIGSSEGTEIIECADGEEALIQYAAHQPEMVLMDIQLKAMNGFEVTERIHAIDSQAKIIFVTSHDTPIYRMKARDMRAKGFISKDNLAELDQLLHQP